MSEITMADFHVLKEVAAERERQIAKGYDALHDDDHDTAAFGEFIVMRGLKLTRLWGHRGYGRIAGRKAAVEIAALCVAVIEKIDRDMGQASTTD